MGKFAQIFLPWDLSANTYAIGLMSITTVYVILGGMISVTITDVIQYTFTTISAIFIGIIAFQRVTAADIAAAVPAGWDHLFFGTRLNLDWSQHIPALNDKIIKDGWELFSVFFTMMVFKGLLVSSAGPAPNYDMQRILSTRSPQEAAKMSGFVSAVLFVPRYLMIVGITLLGLVFFKDQIVAMGADFDAEQILPNVIGRFLPAGLVGLILAGLLAAFMSSYNSTVNAGTSYIVNDLYKKYINPKAPDKKYVHMSYLCSILVVVVGICFGLMTESVNTVTQWIVSGLFGGYATSNVLKWYWWRFNGMGYFGGMVAGIASALCLPLVFTHSTIWGVERNMLLFPAVLAVSTLIAVVVSLRTKPDDEQVLKSFYQRVRPWGFWGPIRAKVMQENPGFQPNRNFARDIINVAVGIPWQLTLVLIPTYLLIRSYRNMWIAIAVLVVTSVFLKKNWYDKLSEEAGAEPAKPRVAGGGVGAVTE
jgi:Na+/proline symporter